MESKAFFYGFHSSVLLLNYIFYHDGKSKKVSKSKKGTPNNPKGQKIGHVGFPRTYMNISHDTHM